MHRKPSPKAMKAIRVHNIFIYICEAFRNNLKGYFQPKGYSVTQFSAGVCDAGFEAFGVAGSPNPSNVLCMAFYRGTPQILCDLFTSFLADSVPYWIWRANVGMCSQMCRLCRSL